jgi:hypothetical protein
VATGRLLAAQCSPDLTMAEGVATLNLYHEPRVYFSVGQDEEQDEDQDEDEARSPILAATSKRRNVNTRVRLGASHYCSGVRLLL